LSPFSLLGLLLGLCVPHGFFDFDRARRPGKDLVVFFLSFFLSFFFFEAGEKRKRKRKDLLQEILQGEGGWCGIRLTLPWQRS